MIKFTDGKNIYTLTDDNDIIGTDTDVAKVVKVMLDFEASKNFLNGGKREKIEILKNDFAFEILEDTTDYTPEFIPEYAKY